MMQRTQDIDVKIEEGRFIAEHIPGARFIEFSGRDHLFWVGNTKEVLEEMKAFILNVKPIRNYEERLYTIVAARIISAHTASVSPHELIGQLVQQYRGRIVQFRDDTLIATFEGPSKAVHCSIDLVDAVQDMNAQLAVGIHIREGAVDEAFFISGETENFVKSMLQLAEGNEILLTQTVKNLLSGAGLTFTKHKMVFETLSGESFLLYVVNTRLMSSKSGDKILPKSIPKNDSLLEDILQSIDNNLTSDAFGVEMLCRELGMSERKLQRKLKAITNKSPNQLITSVRLHRAKELLTEQEKNIAEAAFKTGFSSPSYNTKCFKKEFGITPSDLLLQV
jgi:AraC-like DNA-binding protein